MSTEKKKRESSNKFTDGIKVRKTTSGPIGFLESTERQATIQNDSGRSLLWPSGGKYRNL